MRSVHLFVVLGTAVVGVAYLVFSPGPSHPRPPVATDAPSSDPNSDLVIGKPFVWQNLTIFPVSSKTPRQSDRFITLDEGLRAGTVEIFERGAASSGPRRPNEDSFAAPQTPSVNSSPDPFGTPAAEQLAPQPSVLSAVNDPFAAPAEQPATAGNSDVASTTSAQLGPRQELFVGNSVNELMVVNRSEKPLYLMPGEIIIGGDQDRTIAEELVIAPGNQPTALNVFCVEHGRWGGRSQAEYASIISQVAANGEGRSWDVDSDSSHSIAGFSGNMSLVVSSTQQIAEQANSGKFVGSIGSLNKPVRLAVQGGEGQGKVWDEVANQNAKANLRPRTGTFTGNYSDAEVLDRLAPFLKELQAPISETPNVVGVIVAVNGEVESMDVFESTPLFTKLWPKLLKSYALDASSAKLAEGEIKQATMDEANHFMRDIANAKNKQEDAKGDLELSRNESDDVLLFTVHERRSLAAPARAMGGMGGGFFGGAVHSAGFSK